MKTISKATVEIRKQGHSKAGNLTFEIASMTNPAKSYSVTLVTENLKPGVQPHFFCSCPAYIYQKGMRKACKHIKTLGLQLSGQVQQVVLAQ